MTTSPHQWLMVNHRCIRCGVDRSEALETQTLDCEAPENVLAMDAFRSKKITKAREIAEKFPYA